MIIKNFTSSPECKTRAHCSACLGDEKWRKSIGAPDICPHGVTLDALPPIQKPEHDERSEQCKACDSVDCKMKRKGDPCRAKAIRHGFKCPDGHF